MANQLNDTIRAPIQVIIGPDSNTDDGSDVRYNNPTTNNDLAKAVQPESSPLLDGLRKLGEYISSLQDVQFSPGTTVGNRLTGNVGEGNPTGERYQTWPERMIRSGFTLPGDVMSGQEPITDSTGHTSSNVIQRAQDTAGLMGGSGFSGAITKGLESNALGIVPVPKEAVVHTKPNDPVFLQAIENSPSTNWGPQGLIVDVSRAQKPEMVGQEVIRGGVHYLPSNRKPTLNQYRDQNYLGDYGGPQIIEGQTSYANPLPIKAVPNEELGYTALRKMLGKKGWDNLVSDYSEHAPKDITPFLQKWAPESVNQASILNQMIQNGGGHGSLATIETVLGSQARKAGYDGVIGYTNQFKTPKIHQIFDVRENQTPGPNSFSTFSDTQQPGMAISALGNTQPKFFSPVEQALESATQKSGPLQQWLGFLRNSKGVKPEELDWLGLENAPELQQGNITKQQLQDYVNAHKVDLQEVTKSHAEPTPDVIEDYVNNWADDFHLREGRNPNQHELENARNEIADDMSTNPHDYPELEGFGTKYSNYQLPGGENYREHLLTLPSRIWPLARNLAAKAGDDWNIIGGGGQNNYLREAAKSDYHSSHWNEPNVLAHIRSNERDVGTRPVFQVLNMKSGNHSPEFGSKEEAEAYRSQLPASIQDSLQTIRMERPVRSLHLEEIQSDWHQQGRKKGYKSDVPSPDQAKNFFKISDEAWSHLSDKEKQGYAEDMAKNPLYLNDSQRLPDAPFKTSWPELAMKRMIQLAAQEGKTRISWTPGEAQAARYDLSKQIDGLRYYPESKQLWVKKKGASYPEQLGQYEPDKLPDVIGKDAAEKLLKTEKDNNGGHSLEGLDLKVGGEGMKGFYDKMLPKMVEKLGKAYGVKVKRGNTLISQPDDEIPTATQVANHPVHYFDIPPAMAEQATGKGMPLFVGGVPVIPVDHDPFKEKKK